MMKMKKMKRLILKWNPKRKGKTENKKFKINRIIRYKKGYL